MRKAVLVVCLLLLPMHSGCSLNWLFNVLFDNPHAGGNGSQADIQRTYEWESQAAAEMSRESY